MSLLETETRNKRRLPEWLRRNILLNDKSAKVHALIKEFNLNTVCQSARCPNRDECFSNGTATFMILGNTCTRGCTFCSVPKGKPKLGAESSELIEEPNNVARAAKMLRLRHVVITSVNRDDLPDQGSGQFAKTILALKEKINSVTVEVLTPDFRGNKNCIKTVVDANPDIYNHNLETVPRLYKTVRPGAIYKRSLELLKYIKELNPNIITKSGIMLGLGENLEEVINLMDDLLMQGCDYLTLGQYMQPTRDSIPVNRYLQPVEFEMLKDVAVSKGFKKVFSGPLVRSSYHAEELHRIEAC